jgi:hypothetical protein
MIAYTKNKKSFGCDFPWFLFTILKMTTHTGFHTRDVTEEKSGKEQLIRELTQNNRT